MKLILTLATLLLLGSVANAQITVVVSGNDKDSQTVVDALKAKIGGTTRYAISEVEPSIGKANTLTFDLTCMTTGTQTRDMGYVCFSSAVYFPFRGPLHTEINEADNLVQCGLDGEYCAEKLFERFVEATQPDKLTKLKATLQEEVDLYLANNKR